MSSQTAERPKKRKKIEHKPTSGWTCVEGSARSLSVLTGIAAQILTSLPLQVLQDDVRQAVFGSLRDWVFFAEATILSWTEELKENWGPSTFSLQVIDSALIRLVYTLRTNRRLSLKCEPNHFVINALLSLWDLDRIIPELRVDIVCDSSYYRHIHTLNTRSDSHAIAQR